MMISNPFSLFNIARICTTICIASGAILLIVGIMNNTRPMIIGGVVAIMGAAFMGVGTILATRQRIARPIQNINISNPLLVDTV